ncbi:hypothetical protein ACFU98_10465 [Streptomyces sp. NPDC057575]
MNQPAQSPAPAPAAPVLTLKDVSKSFGSVRALHDVSLSYLVATARW